MLLWSRLEQDYLVPRTPVCPLFTEKWPRPVYSSSGTRNGKPGTDFEEVDGGGGSSLIKCQVTGAATRPVIIYLRISLSVYPGGKAEKRSDVSIIRPPLFLLYRFPAMIKRVYTRTGIT